MYPFMTLRDGTEVVHSECRSQNDAEKVKVYFERPADGGFNSAECWLPDYQWVNISGFSNQEITEYQAFLESVAHIVYRLAREGGFENAASL
jgi:hypothetical protein